jgi:hypothetical protein
MIAMRLVFFICMSRSHRRDKRLSHGWGSPAPEICWIASSRQLRVIEPSFWTDR